jgi:hypothetical protein
VSVDTEHVPGRLELERKIEPEWAQEFDRSRETRKSSPVIEAVTRTSAGRGESQRSAFRNVRIRLPELAQVMGGLLEVIADDFVALDERVSVFIQPAGKAGMQIGADGLRESVVGGVPD